MLQLPEAWKETLAKICRSYVPDFEVWVYGSRTTDQCHAGSDLDLLLIHQRDVQKPCQQLLNLKDAIEKSHIPVCVDILDWACIPESFRQQIGSKIKLF